ncbi:P-loop NTPase fold protein [Rheinheimera hassiensis]|uniref:P-loop NTPase fold protein n=1 Tax=Rheinheimera hassiensis TaxID=1193627 RepID=UPI001F06A7DA|nr:P-loop NTPase fold protein [Rheinheimera hassiensis]
MSAQFVREQLRQYANKKQPGVFALVGEWGVGKTHLWNELISSETFAGRSKYSYVSLFGIDSVTAIEKELFINHVPLSKASKPADLNTFMNLLKDTRGFKATSVEKGYKYLAWVYEGLGWISHVFGRVPIISKYVAGFDIPLYKLLPHNDTLICFDDIERHSSALELEDFFGYVEKLKTSKSAQIVLLLNRDQLKCDVYRKYKEKVIDYELLYAPLPDEAFDIAFSEHLPDASNGILKDQCSSLKINNIRILMQIARSAEQILPLLEGKLPETYLDVLNKLVLIHLCDACSTSMPETIPPLDYVSTHTVYQFFDDDPEKKYEKWRNTLIAASFENAGDIFEPLVNGVTSGIHDCEVLSKHITKIEQSSRLNQNITSYNQANTDLWTGFTPANDASKLQRLTDATIEHAENIPPHEIDDICFLMDQLPEFCSRIQEFVRNYLDKVNIVTKKSLSNRTFKHPVLQEFVSKLAFEDVPIMPFKYAIGMLAQGKADNQYLKRVSVATEDDFYDFFKDPENSKIYLKESIQCLLAYGSKKASANLSLENIYLDIYTKTCNALRRHAKESDLSRFLIEKYLPIGHEK